jgi:hypothetical protein
VPTPLSTSYPTEHYKVLGVELNTSLSFTTYCRELRRQYIALNTALRRSPLTQSRCLHAIRGIYIRSKHFTLFLGIFTDPQLHTLDGTTYRALRSAVHLAPNLPRTALHRHTYDLDYGLPYPKATAAQLTTCLLHKCLTSLATKAQWHATMYIQSSINISIGYLRPS